jgi:tRNA pseudouridine38-40 synthase
MPDRYFIELAFNGRNYHGWQIQQNAMSVQATLNHALSVLLKTSIETIGCGRTDTGVHARQFFVHFNADIASLRDARKNTKGSEKKLSNLSHHLNRILPNDIAIQRIFQVADDAHARFDAISRTYEYHIYKTKNPFLNHSAHFIHDALDLDLMNVAAASLFKYSDFSCFSKSRTQVLTNNCTILKAHWKIVNDLYVFEISANRFLRNMVRAIVGTLLEVGRKRITASDFIQIIEGKKRSDAGVSVPACGLYLTHVVYPPKIAYLASSNV